MPFTTPEKRKKVDALTDEEVRNILLTYKSTEAGFNVGDKCYYFYKKMIWKWHKERRWTTAHNIYKQLTTYSIMEEDKGYVEKKPGYVAVAELLEEVRRAKESCRRDNLEQERLFDSFGVPSVYKPVRKA